MFLNIIYLLVVFCCGASKTLNPSLSVDEIHQTLRAKKAPDTFRNRSVVLLRVQIIPQLYKAKFFCAGIVQLWPPGSVGFWSP
jgi:hypothetical protein